MYALKDMYSGRKAIISLFFILFLFSHSSAFSQTYEYDMLVPTRLDMIYIEQPADLDSSGGTPHLYVLDRGNSRVQKLTSDGSFVTAFGSSGSGDGQFDVPRGIAVDSMENVYVSETTNNHRIQKFDSAGTFLAKWGSECILFSGAGCVDSDGVEGPLEAGDGQFYNPSGITVDGSDFLYVADSSNHRIQKFDSNGNFLAKWGRTDGTSGSADGEFNGPEDIAADTQGYLYVVDRGNARIQKFDATGTFIMKWGSPCTVGLVPPDPDCNTNGAGAVEPGDGQFDSPSAIATDKNDNVYVLDGNNNRIQMFDSNGTFIAKWGSKGIGDGKFGGYPQGITVDRDGHVFVADTTANNIQKFTTSGKFLNRWGLGVGDGEFVEPQEIAKDSSGNIYVMDMQNARIQKLSQTGQFLAKWGSYCDMSSGTGCNTDAPGALEPGDGQFAVPAIGIAVGYDPDPLTPDEVVYVIDTGNNRVQKFDLNGNFLGKWGSQGSGNDQFMAPEGVAVNASGLVYVADTMNHRIMRFTSSGAFRGKWGTPGSGDYQFNQPRDVEVDSSGNIFVSDALNNRIHKYDVSHTLQYTWGTAGSADGQFSQPEGLGIDSAGNVYVVDTGNSRVQKFSIGVSGASFITKFGTAGTVPGELLSPRDATVGAIGQVYVTDRGNNRITVYEPVTTAFIHKAIIVAGGGSREENPQWETSQMLTNLAYRALLTRGLSKDDIKYFSPVEVDLDGNGNPADDVDGDATNENIMDAICGDPCGASGWAADADMLIIYLTGPGWFQTFMTNGTEALPASGTDSLDSWLDTLQTNHSVKVVIAYDAPNSGSFLPELIAPVVPFPAGKERIVISGGSLGEGAHMVSHGYISYSYPFWSRIFRGLDINASHEGAVAALKETPGSAVFQAPLIDDDGDGDSDGNDGVLAAATYIGSASSLQGNIPVIGSVSSNQVIDGQTSATMSASDVTDVDGIARVWGVVMPPGYANVLSIEAIKNLPSFEMVSSDPLYPDDYTGQFDGFIMGGTYIIAMYAIDRRGNISFPKFTRVTVNNPLTRKAVLVVGITQTNPLLDPMWPWIESNIRAAYDALVFQGYADDNIKLLSPAGIPGVGVAHVPNTLANLSDALTVWAKNSTTDVVLYMTGYSDYERFRINDTEMLFSSGPGGLGSMIDDLQNTIAGRVTVIYDAGRSGSFFHGLVPDNTTGNPDKQRIVVTASRSFEPSLFVLDGMVSFSRYFWQLVSYGNDVRNAYQLARDVMYSASNGHQAAQLNDNNNEFGSEANDGQTARYYKIGSGVQRTGGYPVIGSVSTHAPLNGTTSATVWVKDVNGCGIDCTNNTVNVRAVVVTPGYEPEKTGIPGSDLDLLTLDYAGNGKFEETYAGFSLYGSYKVIFYAEDSDGDISFSKSSVIDQIGPEPDAYEVDDTVIQAQLIKECEDAQQHNFHDFGDVDWVKFRSVISNKFIILASDVGSNADVVLEIIDTDGMTVLASADNGGLSTDELLNWENTEGNGMYYIKVSNNNGIPFADSGYDLSLCGPPMATTAPYVTGEVYDTCTDSELSGIYIYTDETDGWDVSVPTFSLTHSAANDVEVIFKDMFGLGYDQTIEYADFIDSYTNDIGRIYVSPTCTDNDGDGYGSPGLCSCTSGSSEDDCDDSDDTINPGAAEICDSVDNDCDGLIDDADPDTINLTDWYQDSDGDGYGDSSVSVQQCAQPGGYVSDNTDCDDSDANLNPGGEPVRVTGSSTAYYSSLQTAYDSASDGDTIECKETTLSEDIEMDRGITVTVEGGFECSFSSVSGVTTISSSSSGITISDGTVTMEYIDLQ